MIRKRYEGFIERLDEYGVEDWEAEHDANIWPGIIIPLLKEFFSQNDLPSEGDIIEYGVGHGLSLDYLKETFPEKNVMGIEYKNFKNRPDVEEMDARHICSYEKYKIPLAFALNELPNWHSSYVTKQSGYCHAMNNLVLGGIYFETREVSEGKDRPKDYPKHVYNNPFYEQIWSNDFSENGRAIAFRRVK